MWSLAKETNKHTTKVQCGETPDTGSSGRYGMCQRAPNGEGSPGWPQGLECCPNGAPKMGWPGKGEHV